MTDAILPHDLPSALDGLPGVRVLSLDCFDTLLWRDSHAPTDIFAHLPEVTPLQRRLGEDRARSVAGYGRDRQDVTIAEIYAHVMPKATAAEREAAIAAELAAEARHCYAFAPTVDLMRTAKARGLQVIIVSDTYLDAAQLRGLIAQAAGEDVAGLIDMVFCSSAFGKPKGLGLYGEVLGRLAAKPHEILHIGDNRSADVDGVAPFGVRTLHLRQFSAEAEERFRHEAAISSLFHVGAGRQVTALQPHRAALALAEPQLADPAEAFGLTVLGPVFHAFESWLQAEAERLAAAGNGTVHWLFLMRDGFLPMQVHAAAGGKGCAVEISRFTATAASFRQDGDAPQFVERELGTLPVPLARQALIPEPDIARLMNGLTPGRASYALRDEMRRAPRRRATAEAGRAMGRRLVEHVRTAAAPQAGDTLMLVDLGYNGSVQNRVAGLIEQELGVHVAGRYLILCEDEHTGLDKRGLIGIDNYDEMSLQSLCRNVALLEQVCTTAMGSVVDYRADGTPVRKAIDIKGGQSETRSAIQAGCLRFAEAQRAAVIRTGAAIDLAVWRKGAAAVLGRIMHLPFARELAVVERFQHDVNLGTERTVALFEPGIAEQGLRQRGLFYLNGAERMYLPAELSGQGLAPKLALLANRRFGLPFRFTDFGDATITLPVMYIAGDQLNRRTIEARATHDGYYLAAVPIGDCRFSVALQFGVDFAYVQLDSCVAVPVARFLDEANRGDDPQIPLPCAMEGMDQLSDDLYHCTDPEGFVLVHPPERQDDTPMMVALAFRPIARRQQDEAADQAEPIGVAA